jgi:hypothetical protein
MLGERLQGVAARLQRDPGAVRAANAIELVAAGALSPAQLDVA